MSAGPSSKVTHICLPFRHDRRTVRPTNACCSAFGLMPCITSAAPPCTASHRIHAIIACQLDRTLYCSGPSRSRDRCMRANADRNEKSAQQKFEQLHITGLWEGMHGAVIERGALSSSATMTSVTVCPMHHCWTRILAASTSGSSGILSCGSRLSCVKRFSCHNILWQHVGGGSDEAAMVRSGRYCPVGSLSMESCRSRRGHGNLSNAACTWFPNQRYGAKREGTTGVSWHCAVIVHAHPCTSMV